MWRAISEKLAAIGGVRIKLDVRSGLHRGVEHRLEPGVYTFGQSPGCDFVLADPELQPLAFELRVGSRTTEVLAEQPMGVHDGSETLLLQSGFRTNLAIPGEIHIGDVTIALRPDDTTSSMLAWTTRNPLLTGLAAIAVIVAGIYLTAQAGNDTTPPSEAEQTAAIQALLADNGLEDRLKFHKDGERWVMRGEVEERRDADLLLAALRAEGLAVDLDVTDRRTTLRNVQTVLAAFPGRFEANWSGLGAISIVGHVPGDEQRMAIQHALRSDVRGVDRLDLDIRTHQDIVRELRARLEQAGMASKIELSLVDNTLLARGQIDATEMESWREIKIWYDLRFEGILPVRSEFSAPGPLGPDIDIRAIWSGEEPYVIAGNGSKYSPGAILPGGWQIIDILSDRVVLDRNGAMVELRM